MLREFIKKLLGSDKWDTSDRRHNLRAPVDFPTRVSFPSFHVEGNAVDLAPTGIRVSVPFEPETMVERGVLVHVKYEPPGWKSIHTLAAKVRWIKKESEGRLQLGLLFDESPEFLAKSWVPDMLAEALRTQGDIDRKQVRAHAAIPTDFEWDGKSHRGAILDISASGALLETDALFEEGCHLDLRLHFAPPFETMDLEAVVCRAQETPRGALLGVAFIPGPAEKQFLQQLVKALITLQVVSKTKNKNAPVVSEI